MEFKGPLPEAGEDGSRTRFLARAGGAKMLADCCDVKLIDGGFLLAGLLPPVARCAANYFGLRMSIRDFGWNAIEEQIFS